MPSVVAENEARPDPDALLAEAKRVGRGRLKVYLGMAPGVGKTYEMLLSGARRRADGVDVAVGVVETHGRKDTEALVVGLEVLSRRPVEHGGRILLEFDIDAALQRRPALLLVDEYAHSNAPGSRHPKRWQDVDELLDAGIDVWTTLNVQHLESLNDVVFRITGVRVRETVPDRVLSDADEIEVVDLTPDELRARLAQGKVYVPETARLAADRFFRAENLIALREMALRRAAQTVDDKLVGHMRRSGIEGPWAAGERILVLIGGDPLAGSLVRAGRRLADLMMEARWTVLHVERPNRPPDPAETARVAAALKLAEQLGGQVASLTADDLTGAVLDYTRRNNITQLVIGRTRHRSAGGSRWRTLAGRSLAHVLLERVEGAALHVVTEPAANDGTAADPPPIRPAWRWRDYAVALAFVALGNGLATIADFYAQDADLAMIFLTSVLLAGLTAGFRPTLVAAGIAAVSYNFFFLEPRLSLTIGRLGDVLTFAVFFAVAFVTGSLTGRVRDQARIIARRAASVASLLTASRTLSAAASKQEAADVLARQAATAAGAGAVVLLPDRTQERGELIAASGSPALPALSTGAMAAARWAWDKGEPAGAGTGTLPQVEWCFWPLQGLTRRAGVAGIEAGRIAPGAPEEPLLASLFDQGAVALERAELAAQTAESAALTRSDQLRAALLNSISHDLRTPLATVLGSATTLLEHGPDLKPHTHRDLLELIRDETGRLARYVANLLDMTRLEGGALTLAIDWVDSREVLDQAAERIARRLGARRVVRDYPAKLTLIRADPVLLAQALANVLENAIDYSPDETEIALAVSEDRGNVVIAVEDQGSGIPAPELDRIFDKFRRIERPSDTGKGVGLGLSIAKGFVQAMGGRIAAVSPVNARAPKGRLGTRILVALPKGPLA